MRRSRNPLVFAACLGLLSLQLSGVHAHTDENGYIGVPETPFTHDHGHHDHGDTTPAHDHEGTKDVSLLDLALSAFKMPLAILALFPFAALAVIAAVTGTEFAYRVLSGRHTRWRPPLRAPPQPA